MCKKSIFLLFALFIIFAHTQYAQVICAGTQIFNSKKCVGDEVSAEETKLLQIINEYRAQNKLAQVPVSKSLSIVANRHLLDIQRNLKMITHSWSDCPYNFKDDKTWNCVTDAPKRLEVDFNGQGYENLYRNLGGNAAPLPALEAWKKSELHNSLILNLGGWNAKKWDEIGIAISGQYAAIWFGTSQTTRLAAGKSNKGLGITFDEVVKNLAPPLTVEKTSSVVDKEIWAGKSKDKSVVLEMLGTTEDIERAAFSLKIKLDPLKNLNSKNAELLKTFVNNIFPESRDAEKWLEANLARILIDPKASQNLVKDNKVMEIRRDAKGFLILTAKPYKKTSAIEY